MSIHPSARIHPTAIISPEAQIAADVQIGPYVVIEGDVRIGEGTVISPYVHLLGQTIIGQQNKIGTGSIIGSEPQHLAYAGQPTTVRIGDRNTIREHVTVHRGSHVAGWGTTSIGNDCFLMADVHVGHDSMVGNNVIIANGTMLGGHVTLQDRVVIAGNTAVHQFCRIGRFAMMTGCLAIVQDVLPFFTVESRNSVAGVNIIGMRRGGIVAADINLIRQAYKLLYRNGLIFKNAFAELGEKHGDHPLIAEMIQFYATSKRGLIRNKNTPGTDENT